MVRTLCFFCFLLTLALGLVAAPADAQALTTLVNFDGTNGFFPSGSLIQGSDGNFYGTAGGGSIGNGYGTVFQMTPSGTLTTLVNFSNTNGADPTAGLVQGNDGNLYGTTSQGGSSIPNDPEGLGYGTVFHVTPSGTLTTLVNFTGANGSSPRSGLVQGSDGNFYGTTREGGANNNGTVFKITSTGTLTILHAFSAMNGSGDNSDGSGPIGGLVQGNDGNFYGTTDDGGSSGDGTVFKMTLTGTFATLVNFTGLNGRALQASLIQGSDGNFYGATGWGGSSISSDPRGLGYGTVFKMTPSGALTTLVNFTNTNGNYPDAALVQGSDGNFYGTTELGGSSIPSDPGGNGYGTVFQVTSSGTLNTLVNFNYSNGADSNGGLVQVSDGTFYGTTSLGGMNEAGTVFRFGAASTPLTVISLSPSSATVGGPTFTLIIAGTNFTNNTTVTFGGTAVTVTAQTATQLKVTVPASAIATTGTKSVVVTDPANGSASAIFTVVPRPPTWNVQDVAAVADGTARLLWDREDGAAGIWIMSASNTETTVGPTYGPYQGWTAQDITAAGDGTSRILWNRYDGATGVWAMDARGNQTSVSSTYGPFSGWKAVDLATAPNGTSRLMWRYTNGQAGILTLNATGGEITVGRNYGPYTGWTATAVGAAGDGTARMLWTRSDGAMGLWSMDSGDLQKTVGPTYGPYSDSHGHWTATDLSTSADGTSNVLWKRSDGAIGVWTFSANNTMTTVGAVYGPYAGFTAAALDAANDKARVLWVRSDRAAGLWSFGSNDLESLIGPVYGPY